MNSSSLSTQKLISLKNLMKLSVVTKLFSFKLSQKTMNSWWTSFAVFLKVITYFIRKKTSGWKSKLRRFSTDLKQIRLFSFTTWRANWLIIFNLCSETSYNLKLIIQLNYQIKSYSLFHLFYFHRIPGIYKKFRCHLKICRIQSDSILNLLSWFCRFFFP